VISDISVKQHWQDGRFFQNRRGRLMISSIGTGSVSNAWNVSGWLCENGEDFSEG
jgi:hypothetical protein